MLNPSVRTISAPGGPACSVREFGSGTVGCVLIHGFGEGSFVWDHFIRSIAGHVRTSAIDLRGHGDSAWDPLVQYNMRSYRADCQALLNSLPTERFILVGHSLGADIAIHLVSLFTARVAGLVVIDFGPDIEPEALARVREDFAASLRGYASQAEYLSWLEQRRALASPVMLRHYADQAIRQDGDGIFRVKADPALSTSDDDWDSLGGDALWRALRTIVCPTLVVRGVASAVLSRSVAERMVKFLPNGRLGVIPNAGHSAMIDNPEGFEATVRPFILARAVA